jgi:hypothetical protein
MTKSHQSISFLLRFSNLEALSWPSSPLLVLLQMVDPNIMPEDESLQAGNSSSTLLYPVGKLVAPKDYSTHGNQLILGKLLLFS